MKGERSCKRSGLWLSLIHISCATAADSPFIQTYIPEAILAEYRKRA